MKLAAISLLLVAALSATCSGGETDPHILAMGAWSKPVSNSDGFKVRGRLLVCDYSEPAALYVELQECSDSLGPIGELYWDPQALACEMTDRTGKAVPPSFVRPFIGPTWPTSCWIKLPSRSSMLLRISTYAGGRMSDGSFEVWAARLQAWRLKPNDTATYFLAGELTTKSAPNLKPDNPQRLWTGKLQFPKMELSLPKLQPTATKTRAMAQSRG